MRSDKEWIAIWNKLHCQHITKGIRSRNRIMANYCERIIVRAKISYYNTKNIIMSDKQYDRFEMYLKTLRPDSKILNQVGV